MNFDDVLAIAPNLKRRLSGVTSTIIRLIPRQRDLGFPILAFGMGLPDKTPKLSWRHLWQLKIPSKSAKYRIWHARRNSEMLFGLILKTIFRFPLKLVFTSASQRHHTYYTKWLISKMDGVIATSEKGKSYLDVPARVIMHGINIDKFCPPKDKNQLKISCGLDPSFQYVGCFGRIRHQKGTDLFVKSMMEALPKASKWKAIVLGRAVLPEHQTYLQNLKKEVEEAGLGDRILFLGEHTNINDWYGVLDLYIAPQRWEGFGLTPLEAMATHMPVVATDVGAFSEIITHETGVIVEKNSHHMADAALHYMLNDTLRETSGGAAREHMIQNFDLNREAKSLIDVYKELLEIS